MDWDVDVAVYNFWASYKNYSRLNLVCNFFYTGRWIGPKYLKELENPVFGNNDPINANAIKSDLLLQQARFFEHHFWSQWIPYTIEFCQEKQIINSKTLSFKAHFSLSFEIFQFFRAWVLMILFKKACLYYRVAHLSRALTLLLCT